jgi:hypothetical protein
MRGILTLALGSLCQMYRSQENKRSQYSFNVLSGYRREGGNEDESLERMESPNRMPDGN